MIEPVEKPPRYCDVVMKGGVTSGILYPPALAELSRVYCFRNLGGTSIGAVAAAFAAAAECGRRRGDATVFERLVELSLVFAQPGSIQNLMRPDSSTSRVFAPLSAVFFEGRGWRAAVPVAIGRVVRRFVGAIVVGGAVVLVPAFGLSALGLAAGAGYWFVVACLTMVIVSIVVAVRFTGALIGSVVTNSFGMCSGHSATTHEGPRITDWVDEHLQRLSGTAAATPLTFGDLWKAPSYSGEQLGDERRVNLELITTNLSHRSPLRLPFRAGDPDFYFDPEEWKPLFPARVLNWLLQHAGESEKPVKTTDGRSVLRLPPPKLLPVVVAVRLSLGVPFLFTAVPLYAVDRSRAINGSGARSLLAERCWFCDGGVCANFPIQLFDAPLPRWPTFGVNLKETHPDHTDEDGLVWLPTNNSAGLQAVWNRSTEGGAPSQFLWFAAALACTAVGWRDALQARLPGFRDRVVHISEPPGEGGFNLALTPDVVSRLVARGRRAGTLLRDRFSWPNHVWVRLRSYMAAQEDAAARFTAGYKVVTRDVPEVANALRQPPDDPPSYKWRKGSESRAVSAVHEYAAHAQALANGADLLADGSPRPRSPLRISPDP